MSERAQRVVARHIAASVTTLLKSDLQPNQAATYIQELLNIENLAEVEQRLGLDLRNILVPLTEHHHNDDQHHNGESILTHIEWVLEDVQRLTSPGGQRQLLSLVALFHDLGKAFTHAFLDGKHTFHKHGKVSALIAENILVELEPDLFQRAVDLIRLHNLFMVLSEGREQSNSLKYLKPLRRERLYKEGYLEDLILFSRADGARAERLPETLKKIELILGDLKVVEDRERQELQTQAARAQRVYALEEAFREILLEEAPYAAKHLPDLREVNKVLGAHKKFALIKQLKDLI